MNYFKISFCIFVTLAASRFIPHPYNFTSLIALSFYVPAVLGPIYIPALLVSFIITDFFIGFHAVILFTWGSVFLIGLLAKFFISNMTNRIMGALTSTFVFFVITNFGVWSLGSYGYTLEGLLTNYTLAIPFYGNTLISTLFFSVLIEIVLKLKFNKNKFIKV
jgi:hypothetical protein